MSRSALTPRRSATSRCWLSWCNPPAAGSGGSYSGWQSCPDCRRGCSNRHTVHRDSCLLCCQKVESPLGASKQSEAPDGPTPATPTRRPGRPVTQLLSRLSHHMDWQPCYSSCALVISKHSIGLLSQLTITGDSGQLQRVG